MPTSSSSDPHGQNPEITAPLVPAVEKAIGESEVEKLTIDDMLQKHCGEFGSWQLKQFVLASLAWALEASHTMVMIFADREPEFRCLGNMAATGTGCDETVKSVCGLKSGSWEWVGGHASSTVAEWGLFCGMKYRVGLVQSIFFTGCMIGAGIFGHLSDSKLGRKWSLTVVCMLDAIFGCLTALSPNYWIYLLLRFLTGLSTGGTGLCAFVLATEPVGPTKRAAAGMSTFYFFSAGIALLSGVAYVFRSWRSLYVASSIPSVFFLICILPFVSESPRWYLVRGRVNDATKLMSTIAKSNGKHLPDGVVLALDEDASNGSSGCDLTYEEHLKDKVAVTGSLIDVIRSPITRFLLFLAVAINFLESLAYYGLSLNVVNLETNLYQNVLLNAIAEMPAYLITAILLDKFGRKPLAIGTLWFSGVFCFIGSFVGGVGMWKVVRMVCGILGIGGAAGTYNLLFIYTAELFPTVVRNAALGCATQAVQMGAVMAPFVVVLGDRLSFLVFGVCGFLGGILSFYLPETMNQPLYDTMAGMEKSKLEYRSVGV